MNTFESTSPPHRASDNATVIESVREYVRTSPKMPAPVPPMPRPKLEKESRAVGPNDTLLPPPPVLLGAADKGEGKGKLGRGFIKLGTEHTHLLK